MKWNPKDIVIPGFTADLSLYAKTESYQIAQTQEGVSDGMKVIPQRHIVVKCAINADNEIHCGYHDYDNGISVSLF
jgi:hypothetical protein